MKKSKKYLMIALSSLIMLGMVSGCAIQGPKGDKGEQGDAGLNGSDGKDGKDGSQIYTGKGSPIDAVKGDTGDIYIDADTGDMYCYGTLGWIKTGNIKGNDGKNGNDGKDGKDGVSVLGISKTSSENGVDTYTITYSDGHTDIFTVTNGKDGAIGAQGVAGKDGHTPTITIGVNGHWYVDGVDTGYNAIGVPGAGGAQGEKGDKGDKGDQGEAGQQGPKGDTGVSVVSTRIDENGHLICTMSDGTEIDAGKVKNVDKHEVRFHVDDEIVQTVQVDDGETVHTPSSEVTAGYSIKGWSLMSDEGPFAYQWNFVGNVVKQDLDFYADFDYCKYTVTFIDEKYKTTVESREVTYDKEYSFEKIEGKTGYTHADWKTLEGISYGFNGTWRIASDLTLYAYWPANKYVVTLDPNNGTVDQTSINVTYDEKYELPTPKRLNYTFLGWYDSSDKKVSQRATWKRTSDERFTAKWTNIQNTYSFDPGDGECDIDSMVIGWDDAYELPIPRRTMGLLPMPFHGWYLDGVLVSRVGSKWNYSNKGGTLVARYEWIKGDTFTVDNVTYPQTKVTDENLIKELDKILQDNGSTVYQGVEYWWKKGYFYRADKISWMVLEQDKDSLVVVSEYVLDRHRFNAKYNGANEEGYYANNYAHSEIRKWLNNEFLMKAFHDDSRIRAIKKALVDNSASTTNSSNNMHACENTEDYIYLLSYQDLAKKYFSSVSDRACYNTEYCSSPEPSLYANRDYWTRSPIFDDNETFFSGSCGVSGDLGGGYAVDAYIGVRPALCFALSGASND